MSVQAVAAAGGFGDTPIRTILIAHGTRHILRLLQVNLERAGYEVLWAGDGLEARHKIDSEAIDLAILDTDMPAPNGYALLEHIRSERSLSHIKVILLLSDTSEAAQTRAMLSGADGFLTEPVNPMDLLNNIRRS